MNKLSELFERFPSNRGKLTTICPWTCARAHHPRSNAPRVKQKRHDTSRHTARCARVLQDHGYSAVARSRLCFFDGAEGSGVAIIKRGLGNTALEKPRSSWPTNNLFQREVQHRSHWSVPTGKYRTIGEAPVPVAYLPQLRARRTLVLRTSSDPATLLDSIRREIHSVDPNVAPTDLETMQQYMSLPLFPARTTGLLLGVSGFLALVLTTIGLLGVIST